MKTILIVLALVIVVWFGIRLAAKPTPEPVVQNQQSTTTVAPKPTEQTTTQTQNTVAIAIQDFAFTPATLTVKKGTTITWTNADSAPHTVTSDSGSVLSSPRLNKGQSFSFTFNTAGTFAYHCAVHPMMKANVVVTD